MKHPVSLVVLSCALINGFYCSGVIAKEVEKKSSKNGEKIPALSEEFLLFLAEIEDVDGELVHPIDLSDDDKLVNQSKVNIDTTKSATTIKPGTGSEGKENENN